MMKGIKKYGIHIPFMPVGFTLFDYTRGSCGDIDAYSAANLEIWNMSFVDFLLLIFEILHPNFSDSKFFYLGFSLLDVVISVSEEVEKVVKTSVTLTRNLWEKAKIEALRRGLTLTEVVEAALKKWLELAEKEGKEKGGKK